MSLPGCGGTGLQSLNPIAPLCGYQIDNAYQKNRTRKIDWECWLHEHGCKKKTVSVGASRTE